MYNEQKFNFTYLKVKELAVSPVNNIDTSIRPRDIYDINLQGILFSLLKRNDIKKDNN